LGDWQQLEQRLRPDHCRHGELHRYRLDQSPQRGHQPPQHQPHDRRALVRQHRREFHTLDLNTGTLTVAGNFNFNLDQNSNTTTTIRNGSININSAFATVGVGRGVSGSSTAIADLSGVSTFSSNTQNFYVGSSTGGAAGDRLTLGPTNSITANLIQVGAFSAAPGPVCLDASPPAEVTRGT
jgi:hypothetical protein